MRFPMAVAFVLALTAYLSYTIFGDKGNDRLLWALGYYFSVGTVLSLSLHLWGEEVKRRTAVIVQAIAQALLAIDAFYLYCHIEGSGTIGISIAHAAGVLAIGLSVFFLPFFREKDDIPAWHFTLATTGTGITTLIVGTIMYAGISLLMLSVEQLFGASIDAKCYLCTGVVCCVTLPLLMFLGLLPQGEEKHDRLPRSNAFLNGIIRYLFLPLAGGYLLVLYVYAARILIRWELPNGWVSWLVVALMGLCTGIVTGLYPARIAKGSRMAGQAMRWLPALALPLLALMTVGIGRRFMDYGITVNRLYLATLNLWFYAVCIGLIAGRGRRISWIPISFSLIFLLTSVLPVNYAGIVRNALRNEVEAALQQGGRALPLTEERHEAWVSAAPREEAERVNSKLKYLDGLYGPESTGDLVAGITDFSLHAPNGKDTVATEHSYSYYEPRSYTIAMPQGYRYCTRVNATGRTDSLALCIPLEDMRDTLSIPLGTLSSLDQHGTLPPPLLRTCRGNFFLLTGFYARQAAAETDSGFRFLPEAEVRVDGYVYHNAEYK